MSDVRVAESAFVGAVAEALKLQDTMLELRMQLQQVDTRAERANEAALREQGFDESTDPELILSAQERFLQLAIDRSGLPKDAPVIKAARQQIRNMREQYTEALRQEAEAFGGVNGPVL